MSKRTPGLPRRPREFWPTPYDAVRPLIGYLPAEADWIEPCAGAGDLIRHLRLLWPGGNLVHACDLMPRAEGVVRGNALRLEARPGLYITNPPWPVTGAKGDPALGIIRHLAALAPTWALLPWDFMANAYFAEVARACVMVVPIGRVSWLNNGQGGKDNACWAKFDAAHDGPTRLLARAA